MPGSFPEQRQRATRVGELPAHRRHQAEAEQQEQEPRDRVLDADRLVSGNSARSQLLVVRVVAA